MLRTTEHGGGAHSLGVFWEQFRLDAARWVRPQDVASTAELTVLGTLTSLLRYPSLRAMAWFRFGSWMKGLGVVAAPGYVQRRIRRLYGLEISPGADIGGGLYVAHTSGTVLFAEAVGRDVTIIGNVTLGMRRTPVWPRIGDRVFIGAGARVLGGISVGSDASVGANAVVVADVEPGATVVGIPARVVSSRHNAAPTGGTEHHAPGIPR